MSNVTPLSAGPIPRPRVGLVVGIVFAALAAAIAAYLLFGRGGAAPAETAADAAPTDELPPGELRLPKAAWRAAGLKVAPAESAAWAETVRVTGRVAIDDDRVAHVFPLVEGRVEEVRVRFGQKVKAGDVLAVIQSKEVGQRKLELVQSRLAREIAEHAAARAELINGNAQELIAALERGAKVEEIEANFRGRPIGAYREHLVTAYANLATANADFDRLEELTRKGVTSEKDLTASRAARDAARATFTSQLEEAKFEAKHQAIAAGLALREAETRVAAGEASLAILGYSAGEVAHIDPVAEGEALSHYPLVAPFDGTILSKDIALLESVGPSRQLFQIADLSTVWVVADVFERHLPLLEGLQGRKVAVRSDALPGLTAEATVFSTGSTIDEATRTVRLRATADNSDGRLKPGLFVTVDLPGAASGSTIRLPESAVFDHAGATFVFVQTGEESFVRRDVTLGRRGDGFAEIVSGLKPGEPVVTSGGFAIKSRMLAELLEE